MTLHTLVHTDAPVSLPDIAAGSAAKFGSGRHFVAAIGAVPWHLDSARICRPETEIAADMGGLS
jgi:hypothetical protein